MKKLITLFMAVLLLGCHHNGKKHTVKNEIDKQGLESEITIKSKQGQDTAQTDTVYDEYLGAKLAPIHKNYKKIDTITAWSATVTKAIKQSTEGGTATYYYLNKILLKIVVTHFGEMGKIIQEFYTLDGALSFVLEKRYEYNRPLSWDDSSKQENNDNAVFDAEKSTLIEDRSFFEKGTLIRQISDLSCGAPFAQYYLDGEQKRLKDDFNQLLKRINK
ncbi:hypothetical protein [uncultured Marixanthomonas sp.]|uniref:hypothetical protein n=1 Tax=uncultured Marixanthomonas sp. TaxID=757245 RepID=UPI0030D860EB|tara:strand:- start:72608 stop:73261 length:654 start_codon:yes stop_codon:yes gene_type:complete